MRVGSAWRPSTYQAHLQAIVRRDAEIRQRTADVAGLEECSEVMSDVAREMSAHSLRPNQAVAEPGSSRHERGQAFDVTPVGLDATQINTIAAQCGVTRQAVPGEPWHFQ